MSQDTNLARSFLLKFEDEKAQKINEFRWSNRQESTTAAVRKLIDLGLEAAAAQKAEQSRAA
jgi:hypothetical protein